MLAVCRPINEGKRVGPRGRDEVVEQRLGLGPRESARYRLLEVDIAYGGVEAARHRGPIEVEADEVVTDRLTEVVTPAARGQASDLGRKDQLQVSSRSLRDGIGPTVRWSR